MKIQILPHFLPDGQIQNLKNVSFELSTRPTYPVWESKGFLLWYVKYVTYYEGTTFLANSLHAKITDECSCHLPKFVTNITLIYGEWNICRSIVHYYRHLHQNCQIYCLTCPMLVYGNRFHELWTIDKMSITLKKNLKMEIRSLTSGNGTKWQHICLHYTRSNSTALAGYSSDIWWLTWTLQRNTNILVFRVHQVEINVKLVSLLCKQARLHNYLYLIVPSKACKMMCNYFTICRFIS